MADDVVERWLARALVASFLVNVLLAVWLWSARRPGPDVERADNLYQESRVVRDSARTIRVNAVDNYSRAREVLVITDTLEVIRVLTLADSAIAAGERSEAAADTALARADDLIAALKKANKPKLIQPYIEATHNPHTKEYAGRIGVEVRTIKNVSLIAVAEVRKDGTGFAVGIRIQF